MIPSVSGSGSIDVTPMVIRPLLGLSFGWAFDGFSPFVVNLLELRTAHDGLGEILQGDSITSYSLRKA